MDPKRLSDRHTLWANWIVEQLNQNMFTVETLIQPVRFDIFSRTTNQTEFGCLLIQFEVLNRNQLDECTTMDKTSFAQNAALYGIIEKMNAGPELIKALANSNNWHILEIIYKKHNTEVPQLQVDPVRRSTITHDGGRPQSNYSQGSFTFLADQASTNNNSIDHSTITTNRRLLNHSDNYPSDLDEPSSESNLIVRQSITTQSSSNRTSYLSDTYRDITPDEMLILNGLDKEGQPRDIKELLPILTDLVPPKRKRKKIILSFYKFKIKHLTEFLKPFKDTLEHLELDNVIIISPNRPKLVQRLVGGGQPKVKLGKLRIFMLNQIEFLDDTYTLVDYDGVQLRAILSSVLHIENYNSNANYLTKFPTLWSLSGCHVIDLKRNGATILTIKKRVEGQQQSQLLVLRDYAFLKCHPFLLDATDLDKLSCFGVRLQLTWISHLVKELNLYNCILEVVQDMGSLTKVLLQFTNLTSLIINNSHLPTMNTVVDIDNIFKLSNLEVLVLRNVKVTGELNEGSELNQIIMKKQRVIFYQCDLSGLKNINTNSSHSLNKDSVIAWTEADKNPNASDLVWSVESSDNVRDDDYLFEHFQLSDFTDYETWKNNNNHIIAQKLKKQDSKNVPFDIK